MEESFRLGRIAGIRIGANWSLLVIAWLIAWGLAGDALPSQAPGWSTAAYWVVGVLTAVLFFVSLLLHELAHSLVARRHGVDVQAITLWLFGGVSKLEHDTTSADAELRIAVVGPLTSLGLAAAFGVVAVGIDAASAGSLPGAAAWWLCSINLLLGLFNLLPAFPLDGGRVLRAWLWHRGHDRLRATVTAARVGQLFAYALVGLGLLGFAGGAVISGLWFVFLGWFLLVAARMEATGVTQQDLLAGLAVAQVMTADPVTVPGHLSVAELIDQWLFRYRHSAYPVVEDDGRPVGLITLDRIRLVDPASRSATRVDRVAFPLDEVPVVAPTDLVTDLVPRLVAARCGRALVVDDGRVVGIVSHVDLTHALEFRALWQAGAAR